MAESAGDLRWEIVLSVVDRQLGLHVITRRNWTGETDTGIELSRWSNGRIYVIHMVPLEKETCLICGTIEKTRMHA